MMEGPPARAKGSECNRSTQDKPGEDQDEDQALSLSLREVVYQNLLLLGFQDVVDTNPTIKLDRDMFMQRNQRALELVFHFLFTKAAPTEAVQGLEECWPIIKQRQELLFRKAVKAWLTRLEAVPGAGVPFIDSRLLVQPEESLYYPLLKLTSYVMRTVAERDYKASTQRAFWSGCAMNLSLQSVHRALIHHKAKATVDFVAQAGVNSKTQELWLTYSQSLTNEYRAWAQKERQLQTSLDLLKENQSQQNDQNRLARVEAFREVHHQLMTWRRAAVPDMDMMQWMVGEKGHRYVLDVVAPDRPLTPTLTEASAPSLKALVPLVTEQGVGLASLIGIAAVGVNLLNGHRADSQWSAVNSDVAHLLGLHEDAHRRNVTSAQSLVTTLNTLKDEVQDNLDKCRERLAKVKLTQRRSDADEQYRLSAYSPPHSLFTSPHSTKPIQTGITPTWIADMLIVPEANSVALEVDTTATARHANQPNAQWLMDARWELEQQAQAQYTARQSYHSQSFSSAAPRALPHHVYEPATIRGKGRAPDQRKRNFISSGSMSNRVTNTGDVANSKVSRIDISSNPYPTRPNVKRPCERSIKEEVTTALTMTRSHLMASPPMPTYSPYAGSVTTALPTTSHITRRLVFEKTPGSPKTMTPMGVDDSFASTNSEVDQGEDQEMTHHTPPCSFVDDMQEIATNSENHVHSPAQQITIKNGELTENEQQSLVEDDPSVQNNLSTSLEVGSKGTDEQDMSLLDEWNNNSTLVHADWLSGPGEEKLLGNEDHSFMSTEPLSDDQL